MTTDSAPGWLLDVNVLTALALSTHVHHHAAHRALAGHAATWATCPITEAALFRLLLNPRVSGVDFTAEEIRGVLQGMRKDTRWRWVEDQASLTNPTIDASVMTGHRQVTDFHLVNLAAVSGRVLATFDAGILQALSPADRRFVHVLAQ